MVRIGTSSSSELAKNRQPGFKFTTSWLCGLRLDTKDIAGEMEVQVPALARGAQQSTPGKADFTQVHNDLQEKPVKGLPSISLNRLTTVDNHRGLSCGLLWAELAPRLPHTSCHRQASLARHTVPRVHLDPGRAAWGRAAEMAGRPSWWSAIFPHPYQKLRYVSPGFSGGVKTMY